ncbi:uracil-DNA glycosylase family protein [Aminipila sp.]|nr:uracil-DNA glycosylase family protein [Aminipila sp.]
MAEYERIVQPFEPVYDENAKILILGSLPSVKSRENGFYYGHPQNRFWKVIAAVYDREVPQTILEKKELLHKCGIAVWDVIES